MSYEPTYITGTRVKVLSQSKYRGKQLCGLMGTVKSDIGNGVAVLLDNAKNSLSAYGYYYFAPEELLAVDEFRNENVKEIKMNKITNYLNIAKVKFVNMGDRSGVYQYANFEADLNVDDLCVVRTEDNKILVAKVVEIAEVKEVEMYREIIAKVHTGGYNTRLECRAKAAELKSKMEARAKQLQDIALYQMLAKDDPDMAAMLSEYQAIPKV